MNITAYEELSTRRMLAAGVACDTEHKSQLDTIKKTQRATSNKKR